MVNLSPAPNGYLCKEDPGEPVLNKPRWSVNEIEARIVSELCRGLRVLEIGTGLGVSTKEIARRAKWVYTVDIDPWVKEYVASGLPENVSFFESVEGIQDGFPLDAEFIDGQHSYRQVEQDIRDSRKLIKRDGLFVFHDARMEPVKKAVIDSGLQATFVATALGLAIAWNK